MSEPALPHETDESLLESFRYINSVPGKDVRGRLVDCFQLWLNVADAAVLEAIKVKSDDFLYESRVDSFSSIMNVYV